ncbi:hypothetical protein PA598K_01830 [Paenibacillus sp. 598K]|uniref:metallophosphoesterase family protein n=1 Tax=Paenibacillus sp. 598K TaxID=1117987 RepID=UPI000FF9221F|nr:metallophosphoesterase [Paenibacillus sp. 598K]GBF73534.1 hypothetical protein PA598K_01830 [Paenibacillus sp. 598K]
MHQEQGKGTLRACFQVITDTHLRDYDTHLYNRHFAQALGDIRTGGYAEGSSGIMHAGDITDHGLAEEYESLIRLVAAQPELPAIRCTVGNHDVALGRWAYRIGHYEQATGMQGTYHDHWIDGYHYIFLGTETGLELNADLSETQLGWLDARLAEDAATGRPAFVFLHQPIKDTTAGATEEQGWHGVEQDEALRAVLLCHPHAILFTGHTHWRLESERTMHRLGEAGPHLFNAASVAYLWQDVVDDAVDDAVVEAGAEQAEVVGECGEEDGSPEAVPECGEEVGSSQVAGECGGEEDSSDPVAESGDSGADAEEIDRALARLSAHAAYVQGSQGYHVEIYDDAVLVRGRDFASGAWVEAAQFRIPLPVGSAPASTPQTELDKVRGQIG